MSSFIKLKQLNDAVTFLQDAFQKRFFSIYEKFSLEMIFQLLIACSSLAFGAMTQERAADAVVEEFPLIDFLSTRDNYSCP